MVNAAQMLRRYNIKTWNQIIPWTRDSEGSGGEIACTHIHYISPVDSWIVVPKKAAGEGERFKFSEMRQMTSIEQLVIQSFMKGRGRGRGVETGLDDDEIDMMGERSDQKDKI